MTISEILAKFGKLFASADATQGVLQGVHYAADGSAVVTNRHYMLRIQGAHSFKEPITLHAKTGQPLDGAYPNFERVFPVVFEHTILLSAGAEVNAALRSAKVMAAASFAIDKKHPIVKMFAQHGTAHLWIKDNDFDLKAFFGNTGTLKPIDMRSLNANYLLTALQVFEAAGTDVTIKLRSPWEPVVLSNELGIDVLILPYRTTS